MGILDAPSYSRAQADLRFSRDDGTAFVALGDSISTSGLLSAGGGGYGASWPQLACALTNQRLNYFGNGGVAGETSAQILARVPAIIALKPGIVSVAGGANDLAAAVPYATWTANMTAIATQLRAAGIRVALQTILPRGTTTYLTNTIKWNAWTRRFAQDYGYDLLDFFALTVNPLTGIYKSGYDGDGVHPSPTAHLAIANYVATELITKRFVPLQATIDTLDTSNLLAHPLLAVGTPTPTGWVTSGSSSADWTEGLVTDTDFKGKAWEVAFTSAASAGNFRSFQSSPSLTTGYAIGDTILMTARAKVTASSGVTPGTNAGLRLALAFGGVGFQTYWSGDPIVHAAGLTWYKTKVPVGTTSIYVNSIVGTIPVGASFTSRVGDFGLFNLTAMGLA